MPTYGYRCQQCSAEFDVWQKMTDEPVAVCPTCGGAGKRLFFPAGIVFKGAGFYATDSRSASSSSSSAKNGSGNKGPKPETSPSKSDTSSSAGSGSSSSGDTPSTTKSD